MTTADSPYGPEQTSDDRDEGWGEAPLPDDDDERYLSERPPHHDRP